MWVGFFVQVEGLSLSFILFCGFVGLKKKRREKKVQMFSLHRALLCVNIRKHSSSLGVYTATYQGQKIQTKVMYICSSIL